MVNPMQVIQHSIEIQPPPTQAELDAEPSEEAKKKEEEDKIAGEALKKIFDKLDANENGVVEKKEMLEFLKNDEEARNIAAEMPQLEQLLTPDTWAEAFAKIDSNSVFKGRKDGVISWPEFHAFFFPKELIKGSITWHVDRMGPVESEMSPCPGTITYTVRLADEGVCEFVMACKVRCPEPPPDLKPWVKKTAASFKGLVEKITYLCPRLVQEWDLYSHVLHHRILRKAKGFSFMNVELARSPSALGFFQRSPTPGIRDGFSPYPAMRKRDEEGEEAGGAARPHSSLL